MLTESGQELGVGNKELALEGTMGNINKVLTGLTYVGDMHFNTRYGLQEKIKFSVNDQVSERRGFACVAGCHVSSYHTLLCL